MARQAEIQATRAVSRIRGILEEVRDCGNDLDLTKIAVEIYELLREAEDICSFCGTRLSVEREVFSRDKLFTGHNCRGRGG